MPEPMPITLGGLTFVPDLSGALYLPEERLLMIADLHFEKATTLARCSVYMPPYDTRHTLDQLDAVIARYQPQRLVFLGDSFHDVGAIDRIDEAELQRLTTLTARHDTVWITGNHDPEIPAVLGGQKLEILQLGPLILRHIAENLANDEFEISGHFHPAAALVQRGMLIRCKCFITDGRRLILPAFGSLTGGLTISASPIKTLFDWPKTSCWLLGEHALYKLAASRLR